MPILIPPPPPAPAAIAIAAQQLPPLAFVGFRAHMPMSEAHALVTSAGGSLICKATTDPRLRECTGNLPFPQIAQPFKLLISSVRDTAAVIVLTAAVRQADTKDWVRALTQDFGTPNYKPQPGVSESWQWIRKGQMLRIVQRISGGALEAAVTLTDGPLLDALGPPAPRETTRPKKKKPD